jgi:ribosomal-protein-alanine N-acetyltransferase
VTGLTIAAEFFPMNAHDLDAVAALEASLQVFPGHASISRIR